MAKILPLIRKRVETAESPFWISYADLMTALVMLFMVVMSISMIAIASQSMEEKRILEKEKLEREKAIQIILEQMEQKSRQQGADVQINRTNHTISFGEAVRFAHDSFKLSEEARTRLLAFVPVLLDAHTSAEGKNWLKRIHIEGYTDETGTYLYNVNLSLNRAQAVVCSLFAADLTAAQQREMRQMLIIDGATVTGIKPSHEESRRVEMRLEFRQLGDNEVVRQAPDMAMGSCAIRPEIESGGSGKSESGGGARTRKR